MTTILLHEAVTPDFFSARRINGAIADAAARRERERLLMLLQLKQRLAEQGVYERAASR